MIEAIIFDMDGVVVDSEKLKGESWQGMFEKYKADGNGSEWYRRRVGTHGRDLCKEFIETYGLRLDVDEFFKEQVAYSKSLERDADIIESTVEFIHKLSGNYKLGVASSNYRDVIEGHLKRAGIRDKFDAITSGVEDIENQKPAPDIYLHTSKNLGVCTWNCVAIEDTAPGVAAAKSASMFCIGYVNLNSGNQDLSMADIRTDNLNEIDLDKIINIFNRN